MFPVVAFCADALLKSASDQSVCGTIKLNNSDKTPIKIIRVYEISFNLN